MYADSGGSTRDASVAAFLASFAQETGVEVVSADLDDARLIAEQGRSLWDGAEVNPILTIDLVRRGLVEAYPSPVDSSDLVDSRYQEYNPGVFWACQHVCYFNEAFEDRKPETWADFLDVRRFPGKWAIRTAPFWVVKAALLADGIPEDEVQPYDFHRAFAKLGELRPNHTIVQQCRGSAAAADTVRLDGHATGVS